MARGYEVKKSRAPAVWLMVGAAIGAAVILAIGHWLVNHHRDENIAAAKAWDTVGPPCPTLTHEAFMAQPLPASRSFNYNGLKVAYAYGYVSCQNINDDGGRAFDVHPVCQFSSPAVLKVFTDHGELYYAPGSGKQVTVSLLKGQTQCVMGGAERF